MLESANDVGVGLQIRPVAHGAIMRLKGWNAGEGSPRALILGEIDAPEAVGRVSEGAVRALCTGPQDWLVVWPQDASMYEAVLVDRAAAEGFFLADLSDAYSAWNLRGVRARELLSKGCALDLHPRSFCEQHCARTRFAQIPVVLSCVRPDEFEIYALRSYARYLHAWLMDACELLEAT